MEFIPKLVFIVGLGACIPLMLLGIRMHRRRATGTSWGPDWHRFIVLSVGITIATLFASVLVLNLGNGGALTGGNYLRLMAFAVIVPLSPGIGTIFAALVMRGYTSRDHT